MAHIPDFHDPQRVGAIFYPDPLQIAAAAEAAALPPAAEDERRVQLLVVDMQIDFCHPQGTLYVPGAEDDIRRLIDFIFRNAEAITDIVCTLDSHLPFQIFHASWWVDEAGRHPEPLTIISLDEVQNGRWRPVVMPDYSLSYVQRLEEGAKKKLTIWPYHVLIGGIGNALDPSLWSVIMWHSLARKTQPTWLQKGRVPQSEHYSAIAPEIAIPDHPQGQKHTPLLDSVENADTLIIAGEAQSHCILETLDDLVVEFRDQPDVLRNMYVLIDCMSPVVHPAIDFGAIAERRFAQIAELGVNFVTSTDVYLSGHPSSGAPAQPADSMVQVSGLQRMGQWDRRMVSEETPSPE